MIPPLTGMSWEAAATFTTGFLAVLGAAFVGLRQAGISRALVRLEELKLREALFERRFFFLDGFNSYAERIADDQVIDSADMEVFLRSAREAGLIFSTDVYRAFSRAREAVERFAYAKADATGREDHNGAEVRTYREARMAMQTALSDFNAVAAREMRLTP